MAEDRMAVLEMLRKATADGDVDVLREGVRVLAEAIMEAEVSELTGAAKGERAPDRRLTNRNGYRERRWDTRVGTLRGCRSGLVSHQCRTRTRAPGERARAQLSCPVGPRATLRAQRT